MQALIYLGSISAAFLSELGEGARFLARTATGIRAYDISRLFVVVFSLLSRFATSVHV